MEFFISEDNEFQRWYSPIKVLNVHPHKTGKGTFELEFYHAAYPAGVQNKKYELRTLIRSGKYLMAERLHDSGRQMTVVLFDLMPDWLMMHFNIQADDSARAQSAMEELMMRSW